jgi:hypothetical protein
MRITKRQFAAILLGLSSGACADESGPFLIGHGAEQRHWRSVDMAMSSPEYHNTFRKNQRLVRNSLIGYSENTLKMIGIPEKGIQIMSGVVSLATKDDFSFHLDKHDTLSLQVKDAADNDRRWLLEFKVDW